MIDFVAKHWNDILTVFTFLVAVATGYYQIRYYRAQFADVNLVSIEDATYVARANDSYGGATSVDPNSYDGELSDTKYSITALVENDGREPTTLSEFTLILPEVDEEYSLFNDRTQMGWTRSFVKLDANERRELNLFVGGEVREEYGDDIEGILRLDTTSGVIEEPITLQYSS